MRCDFLFFTHNNMTYLPAHFEEHQVEVIHELVRLHPLATWVVSTADGPQIHHVPMLLDTTRGSHGTLVGHVARANPIWQELGFESIAVFQGPQAYVSPNWYPTKQLHGRHVPTWNYAVVHAHGVARAVLERTAILAIVQKLTTHFEANQPHPWQVTDAPVEYLDRMLGAIVGIEIEVQRWQAKFKLSQNHEATNRAGVARALAEGMPTDGMPTDDQTALAALMRGAHPQ